MDTYKVKNWPVIDDDGNKHHDGDTVELSDETAAFYRGRLEKVEEQTEKEDPTSDNSFEALPDDTEFPYHYGAGNYFLSDGTKITSGGEEAAIKAQKELDNEQSNSG